MFGGAGVYCNGLFFAIIGDDDLWFKVDDVTRDAFEAEALGPFEIEMNGKTGTMQYYNVPESIFDDHDDLTYWTGLALGAAERAAAKKSAKKSTPVKRRKKKSNKKP